MSQVIPSTTPVRALFGDHQDRIVAVAVFPDRRRMVTGSRDKTLHLWDLETGVVLKKMEGHHSIVMAMAISRDGQLIASGGLANEFASLIPWHGETGESLTQGIKAHSTAVSSLDFSPDGTMLVTGSPDETAKLWDTETWQLQGHPIRCSGWISCIRYSPSGELLAIATKTWNSANIPNMIEIYNPGTRHCVANIKATEHGFTSLAWMLDGTRILSAGFNTDPTIREWDTSTWRQVGNPWTGHTDGLSAIAVHPAGTLIASASQDKYVRLWRLSDRQTIAIFRHSFPVECVTFSVDGKHILSGSGTMMSEWAVPKDALPDHAAIEPASKILAINTTVRDACVAGNLAIAEKLLTQDIITDTNDYNSYANRSFVMTRHFNLDRAFNDAIKSVSIQPSLIGYISKGLALCGKQQVQNAMKAFDLGFTFTDGDPKAAHFLFLIKAIALFNANPHEEEVLPIQELAARPNADPLASRVVESYLRVQLGTIALDSALHKEAARHFTAAVNAGAFFSKLDIHSMYEDFVVLFGWDLKSLWQIANQQRCHALLRTGQFGEALESYRYMMDVSDEPTKAIFRAWIPALNEI